MFPTKRAARRPRDHTHDVAHQTDHAPVLRGVVCEERKFEALEREELMHIQRACRCGWWLMCHSHWSRAIWHRTGLLSHAPSRALVAVRLEARAAARNGVATAELERFAVGF